MKKEYKTPTMVEVRIQYSHILCTSSVGINNESISDEPNEYSGDDGYGEAM